MRHLICSRCQRRLIEDFWVLVEQEPVPTFSRVTLTCECGEVVSVEIGHGMRWLTPPVPEPLPAPVRAPEIAQESAFAYFPV